MYKPITYIQMQQLQAQHDTKYHQDIAVLDTQSRLRHLTLHFGKYSGRLARARDLEEGKLRSQLEKTLTDTFIIALSAANVLNLNLDEIMKKNVGSSLISEYPTDSITSLEKIREKTMYGLVIGQSDLAKALESMDHVEEGTHRTILESGVIEITKTVLKGSKMMKMDLVNETLSRWEYVEKNRIL